jgi:hypothetical protein
MNRSILAVALVAVLAAGCASQKPAPVTEIKDKLEQKPDISKAEAEFMSVTGTLQLQFSEDGQWILIKSSGTAPVNFNHPQGREDAFMLATMRAKRNLAEFLSNDLRSTKVTENLTKTSLRDLVTSNNSEKRDRKKSVNEDDDNLPEGAQVSEEERRRANRIAQSVTESITDSSQAILRGAFIATREINRDNNMVVVTMQVSRKSINAAAQVRTMMNGL